jgi:hypothetical protein
MAKVVRNASRDLCYAAQKITPYAKAHSGPRWVHSSWKAKPGSDNPRFRWPKPTAGAAGSWIPWHRQSAAGGIRRIKESTPLTKAGWFGALEKLGVKLKHGVGKQVRAWGVYQEQRENGKYGLVTGNQAPWIETFDKGKNPLRRPLHITERAMTEVVKTMDKRLNNMAANVAAKFVGVR